MNISIDPVADTGAERFYNEVGRYALLSAAEEQQQDEAKWHASTALLQLFIKDSHCRTFLRQWAQALQQSAPAESIFGNRRSYLALRREQFPLIDTHKKRRSLAAFAAVLDDENFSSAMQAEADKHLNTLKLSPVLVTAMAEHLLQEEQRSETGTALKAWAISWASGEREATSPINKEHIKRIRQALRDYETARNTLVNHNLRLVYFIAGKTQSHSSPFMDRVQSGILGLIRAAEKFESSKGYRFSTYAYNWINQAIRRSFEDQQGVVRYPTDVSEKISKMYRINLDYINAHGREPNDRELAELMKMKPESLFKLRQVTNLGVSLDSQNDDDSDGIALAERISGDTFASPTQQAEQESLNRCLSHSLTLLSEQEQRVVDMRWGLKKGRALTRKELAIHLNMSQERIRQIETKALKKLRGDQNIIEQYRHQLAVE